VPAVVVIRRVEIGESDAVDAGHAVTHERREDRAVAMMKARHRDGQARELAAEGLRCGVQRDRPSRVAPRALDTCADRTKKDHGGVVEGRTDETAEPDARDATEE
jgi:hypothetical protein